MIAAAAAIGTLAIPGNYTVLHPRFALLLQVSILVGVALVAVAAIRGVSHPGWRRAAYPALVALVALSLTAAGSSEQFLSNLQTVAPIVAGIGVVGVIGVERAIKTLGLLSVALMVTLVLDALTGAYLVHQVFGPPRHSTVITAGLRARGFIGQPVPAAVFQVSVAVLGLFYAMTWSGGRAFMLRGAAIVLGLGGALLAGTRSALLLLVIGLFMLTVVSVVRRGSISPRTVSTLSFLLAGGVAISAVVPSSAFGRVLEFGELRETISFSNRLRALDFLEYWTLETAPDKVLGHGARSLQTRLQDGTISNGISTVDNMFVTVLWDFGVLGVAVCLVVAFMTFRTVFSRRSSQMERAAAASLSILLLSSLFFDTFYTTPLAFVAGALWACRGSRELSETAPSTVDGASRGAAIPTSAAG
ncbi:hypothetical protein [Aeromicrobium sp.]|uniref:hypothetical protein n=1 Tax=Aeromicrobium sp. TaxID=1871063 RepID=UPI0028B1856C|nr:hypothetical protein [Aeromicrobium sp.]